MNPLPKKIRNNALVLAHVPSLILRYQELIEHTEQEAASADRQPPLKIAERRKPRDPHYAFEHSISRQARIGASTLGTSRLTTILILLLAGSVSCSRPQKTEGSRYKVTAVADGDTITVLDLNNNSHRIRLQGIDAPERGQAVGTESRQHLNDLLFGKDVMLQGEKSDKYGRILCKVLVDGRDANLEQINAGFAWSYRQYEKDLSSEDRDSYSNAESQAHRAKRGLWSDPAPTPPWEYRHPSDRPSSSVQ